MSAWRGWLTRMRRGVRRERFEAEMADELRTHLEMEAESRVARGAAPDAARREAAIAFGHVESLKESVRDRRTGLWLAQTAQDVRYAVRLLAKWPTFSTVVIGTIALAVCGTATIFSAFDAALLRPLPYAAPDRLVEIVELLEPVQRRVERPLFDAQHVRRQLLDALGDAETVLRLELQRLQHEQVQRALQQIPLVLGHDSLPCYLPADVIVTLAKSPGEVLPTHKPTHPPGRVVRRCTASTSVAARSTNTLTVSASTRIVT